MKTKHLLLMSVMLMLTVLTAVAQNATDKKLPAENISFGKKLPPPDITNSADKSSQQMTQPGLNELLMQAIKLHDKNAIKKTLDDYRQQLKNSSNQQALHIQENNAAANHASSNSNFHLTKDINALAESNPRNYSWWYGNISYAILHQLIYFAADDGIHGNELWRSDGTAAGTFMVMDIEPGSASSSPREITAVNGKIYFAAATSTYGSEPWVSDGTEGGTQLLMDIAPGTVWSEPAEFVQLGKKVYFVTDVNDFLDGLWQTDGTTAGTKLVKSLGTDPGGQLISQLINANGLLFFTFISYTTGGFELWRSDGTDAGTYHVGTNATFYSDFPDQLTSYNSKLYFSADDGTGNKLWVTDGTDAGTTLAPGNHNVIIDVNLEPSFPIVKKVLYMQGEKTPGGNALYKYDASDGAGLVKVKNLAPPGDAVYVPEWQVVSNTLYFKATNYTGGMHDELWSSKGTRESTKRVYKLLPGETIKYLYNGSGILYFVKADTVLGTELWRTYETSFGIFPLPVSDIFKGTIGSYPDYLTAFNGKLIFAATDKKKGNELFITGGDFFNTTLVKDINTVSTLGSYAGYYVRAFSPLGNSVLFSASEKVHGYELYKSDGTEEGTELLNDILPGEKGSFGETGSFPIGNMMAKKNSVYFITQSSDTTYSIYKTNGLKQDLHKVVPDYHKYPQYFIQDFNVADNGLVFYVLFNYNTSKNELWRSDGTATGTFLLASALSSSFNLNVAGNTAFFVGSDAVNGFELWKSDGSVHGTGIVKDVNPGAGNSNPVGMFAYKKDVYFAANNGAGPSFWKSDGTIPGTIQLGMLDPWYTGSVLGTALIYFEVSNNIVYFAAIDYTDSKGTQLYRTDGTVAGTYAVADINPNSLEYDVANPSYLTDVNGTLFFIGNDGVHGAELWKSDGTAKGTQLVKDITPGADPSTLYNLISFKGKLYFTNSGALWSSDGTADGTTPVDDAGISDVYIYNIVAANNQLFLSGSTQQYGVELYAGKVNATGKFVASKTANQDALKANLPFNAMLYPNPVVSNAALQLTGDTKNLSISITDMSGKKLWQNNNINTTLIKLPVEKYPAGTYIVTVTNGTESKIIKLVKQ